LPLIKALEMCCNTYVVLSIFGSEWWHMLSGYKGLVIHFTKGHPARASRHVEPQATIQLYSLLSFDDDNSDRSNSNRHFY
jgi:hypothetical protein